MISRKELSPGFGKGKGREGGGGGGKFFVQKPQPYNISFTIENVIILSSLYKQN